MLEFQPRNNSVHIGNHDIAADAPRIVKKCIVRSRTGGESQCYFSGGGTHTPKHWKKPWTRLHFKSPACCYSLLFSLQLPPVPHKCHPCLRSRGKRWGGTPNFVCNERELVVLFFFKEHGLSPLQIQLLMLHGTDHNTGFCFKGKVLTLFGPGVVFPKGIVFGNIWVKKFQGVFRNILSRHHLVAANNIGQANRGEFLLCVGFH